MSTWGPGTIGHMWWCWRWGGRRHTIPGRYQMMTQIGLATPGRAGSAPGRGLNRPPRIYRPLRRGRRRSWSGWSRPWDPAAAAGARSSRGGRLSAHARLAEHTASPSPSTWRLRWPSLDDHACPIQELRPMCSNPMESQNLESSSGLSAARLPRI